MRFYSMFNKGWWQWSVYSLHHQWSDEFGVLEDHHDVNDSHSHIIQIQIIQLYPSIHYRKWRAVACGILWIDLLVVPTHSPRRQLSLYKELLSSFKTNLLWKVKTSMAMFETTWSTNLPNGFDIFWSSIFKGQPFWAHTFSYHDTE